MKVSSRIFLVVAAACLCRLGSSEAGSGQLRGRQPNLAARSSLLGTTRRQLMQDRTEAPTFAPTVGFPTPAPSEEPTLMPTSPPTQVPTGPPTEEPTLFPTEQPSFLPTDFPSSTPTTSSPTTMPSFTPTMVPTITPMPTMSPTTSSPSSSPTAAPTGRVFISLTKFQLVLSGPVGNTAAVTLSTEQFLLQEMKKELPSLNGISLLNSQRRKLQDDAVTTLSYSGSADFVMEPIPTESQVQQSQASTLQNQQGLQAAIALVPPNSNVVVDNVILDGGGGGGDDDSDNTGLIAGVAAGGAVALALLGFVGYRYFKKPPPPPSSPPPPQTSEYEGYETESGRESRSHGNDSSTIGTSNKQKEKSWLGARGREDYDDNGRALGDMSVAEESMDEYSLTGESVQEPEEAEKEELLQKLALYQGKRSRSPEVNRASRFARKPSLELTPGEEGSSFSYDQVGGPALLGVAQSDDDDDSVFVGDDDTPARNNSQGSDVPFDEREGPMAGVASDEIESISKRRDAARELSKKINADAYEKPEPALTPKANDTEEDDEQGLSSYLRERKRAARASRGN